MSVSSKPVANFLFPFHQDLFGRINVKMGGINSVPDPQSVTVLTDPRNPTIVMGRMNFVVFSPP